MIQGILDIQSSTISTSNIYGTYASIKTQRATHGCFNRSSISLNRDHVILVAQPCMNIALVFDFAKKRTYQTKNEGRLPIAFTS